MKHSPRARLRQGLRLGSRLSRRASAEVKDRLPTRSGPTPEQDDDDGAEVSPEPVDQSRRPTAAEQLKSTRRTHRDAVAEYEALAVERDTLRAERLAVQQVLGQQHGKRVMPRLRVEKTNGTPSFVVGQRMMQRVHRRALDPLAGLDGVGAVFGDDNPQGTATFAKSHGVPVRAADSTPQGGADAREYSAQQVVVHAFKGEVGLVEVHGEQGVLHLDSEGADPGDIRPAATYDPSVQAPEALDDIRRWAGVLSAHIPRPYVQLIFSSGSGSAVLDRIDVDPDRIPVLTPDWDERLGRAFDAAYSRFLLQPYRSGGLANRVPGGTFSYEEAR